MKWKLNYRSGQVEHTGGMADTIRLGTIFKSILKARGLSLKKVSTQTGIPYSTLHTWLENRQPKDILKVKRLADYLGVNLNDLLFGKADVRAEDRGPDPQLPGRDPIVGVYEVIIRRREIP